MIDARPPVAAGWRRGSGRTRVRATIDFVDPAELWSRLGHDYRVIVHVTTWAAPDALRIPVGAMFRDGEDWAVFAVRGARARKTVIKIGQRNNRMAEVLSGLTPGDHVISHPSDRVKDGTHVAQREIR